MSDHTPWSDPPIVKPLVADDRYTTSALRGVFVCGRCGSLVANDDRHDDWHRGDIPLLSDDIH